MNFSLVIIICIAFYAMGGLLTYLRIDEKKRLGYSSPALLIYECLIYTLTTALLYSGWCVANESA